MSTNPVSPDVSVIAPAVAPVEPAHESLLSHLNPFHHGDAVELAAKPVVHDVKAVETRLLTVLEAAARDCAKGLAILVKYAPPAEAIATAIYPPGAVLAAGATTVIDLIQKAVISIEATYAANGDAAKTGKAKSADVIALVATAAYQILSQSGVTPAPAYLQNLINVVVGVLNMRDSGVSA